MDWKPWLSRWSEEWVRSADPDELDAQVMRDHWLGFAPAPSDALTAAEARIGLVAAAVVPGFSVDDGRMAGGRKLRIAYA